MVRKPLFACYPSRHGFRGYYVSILETSQRECTICSEEGGHELAILTIKALSGCRHIGLGTGKVPDRSVDGWHPDLNLDRICCLGKEESHPAKSGKNMRLWFGSGCDLLPEPSAGKSRGPPPIPSVEQSVGYAVLSRLIRPR